MRTFAVARIVIVTGSGPQSNVITPPAATARTTAAEVQLAGVPVPTTRSGRLVSTARPAAGTAALPAGLPGAGPAAFRAVADGEAFGAAAVAAGAVRVEGGADDAVTTAGGSGSGAQPAATVATVRSPRVAAAARCIRTGRC
ncbi:hypothetical protein KRMM14A1004_13380 [Krasilnikovia sp. MM14-A1004]